MQLVDTTTLAIDAIKPEELEEAIKKYKKKYNYIDASICNYCNNKIEDEEITYCNNNKFYHDKCYQLYIKDNTLYSSQIPSQTLRQTVNTRSGCLNEYGLYNTLKLFYNSIFIKK